MGNHWNDNGDLVVEEKTLFRQVGWRGQSGEFYQKDENPTAHNEPGGFSPVYIQIATADPEGGWKD